MEIVQQEGKRQVLRTQEVYNLDMIISVGYRINSQRATQFRMWATQRLSDHLVKGYTVNQERLKQLKNGFSQLEKTVRLIQESSESETLQIDEANGQYVYGTIEEQAAHLLYFFIKNHPFSDGNKRIGAFLFVWFLEKNHHRFKTSGEVKINDNGLTALALLVAQSNPTDKELMIKLIINLINF